MQIKAAVVAAKSAPFVIETLELAEPRADELIVRVVASGMLCQTDLHGRDGYHPVTSYPAVFGHEGAGRGPARWAAASERVRRPVTVVMSTPWCGECAHCRRQRLNYCLNARSLKNNGHARRRLDIAWRPTAAPSTGLWRVLQSERTGEIGKWTKPSAHCGDRRAQTTMGTVPYQLGTLCTTPSQVGDADGAPQQSSSARDFRRSTRRVTRSRCEAMRPRPDRAIATTCTHSRRKADWMRQRACRGQTGLSALLSNVLKGEYAGESLAVFGVGAVGLSALSGEGARAARRSSPSTCTRTGWNWRASLAQRIRLTRTPAPMWLLLFARLQPARALRDRHFGGAQGAA